MRLESRRLLQNHGTFGDGCGLVPEHQASQQVPAPPAESTLSRGPGNKRLRGNATFAVHVAQARSTEVFFFRQGG